MGKKYGTLADLCRGFICVLIVVSECVYTACVIYIQISLYIYIQLDERVTENGKVTRECRERGVYMIGEPGAVTWSTNCDIEWDEWIR